MMRRVGSRVVATLTLAIACGGSPTLAAHAAGAPALPALGADPGAEDQHISPGTDHANQRDRLEQEAVSAHMFGNELAEVKELKSIPVNIFAVDPVPGVTNFGKLQTTIPTNVRNYVAFYARDERSWGFAATLPRVVDEDRTAVVIHPMRGACDDCRQSEQLCGA